MHQDLDQSGKAESEKKPIAYYTSLYHGNDRNSEFVEDGSYLKLAEASVRYRFGELALNNFAGGVLGNLFKGITLGVQGKNIFTLTNYTGIDPQVGSIEYRIDSFNYPKIREFTGIVELEL